MVRWVAWTVLILMGGIVLVAVVAAFRTAVVAGLDTRKLPGFFVIVLLAVIFV